MPHARPRTACRPGAHRTYPCQQDAGRVLRLPASATPAREHPGANQTTCARPIKSVRPHPSYPGGHGDDRVVPDLHLAAGTSWEVSCARAAQRWECRLALERCQRVDTDAINLIAAHHCRQYCIIRDLTHSVLRINALSRIYAWLYGKHFHCWRFSY